MNALARLLGIKSTDEIHDINLKFAAWWSEGRPVLVFMVCLGLAALGALFLAFFRARFTRRLRFATHSADGSTTGGGKGPACSKRLSHALVITRAPLWCV